MHLAGCPRKHNWFASCFCDAIRKQSDGESIHILHAERNRLRIRVEELNKLFADAANERDSALAELKKLKGEK